MACYLSTLGGRKGQFLYNGKVFVSSFTGDQFPYRAAEAQSGLELFACPNWQAGSFINNKECVLAKERRSVLICEKRGLWL